MDDFFDHHTCEEFISHHWDQEDDESIYSGNFSQSENIFCSIIEITACNMAIFQLLAE